MNGNTDALPDRFRTIETCVLLARPRAGGLVPEAEAASLDEFADRGIAAELAVRKGVGEGRAPAAG